MKKAKYSEYDNRGLLYVDCSECDRGGDGTAKDKCACGWKTKKGRRGGCFLGILIPGMEMDNPQCGNTECKEYDDSDPDWGTCLKYLPANGNQCKHYRPQAAKEG